MSAMRIDLLRLWRGVCAEAVALADAVERLPDSCECGDADAHIEGRCRCCNGHKQAKGARGGEDCAAILERLRADLTVLMSDFELTSGPLEAAALASQNVELRHGFILAASDLGQVFEAFKRVSEAVAGFRRDCTVAGMRRAKRHCAELRKHCERVNAELFGGVKPMAETMTDPVCRMGLEEAGVKERLVYEGREYYFCSVGCLAEFRRHPRDYAADGPAEGEGEGV